LKKDRRNFLRLTTTSMAAVGSAFAIWPFIDSMNPSADVLALSTKELDLSNIQEGSSKTVKWRGKPVFIKHRTKKEIEEARKVDLSKLKDPQKDEDRVVKAEWLVVVGVCSHLGCIPLGQKQSDEKGDFNGWFCPCHGSHYDSSGRVRRGPAPKNLQIPKYKFIDDKKIIIG
jgi:ubiquinol-cytochrome c reductase iron-sulfur subunit